MGVGTCDAATHGRGVLVPAQLLICACAYPPSSPPLVHPRPGPQRRPPFLLPPQPLLSPHLPLAVPQDVDFVITTRELGRMLDMKHIHLASLTPQAYDSPMGLTTGAAVIFGNTGGVMEAAVRTAYHMVTGKELESFNLTPVRGFEGVKEATLRLVNESAGIDKEVRIAVANGIGNARALVDGLKKVRGVGWWGVRYGL